MERKTLPTTIENWYKKDFQENAIEGKCQTCKFFLRVKRESLQNCMNQPGFCRIGQLEGDYSLYISSSRSRECPAFVEDWYNKETYLAECFLHLKSSDFKYNMNDGRTKEAKMIKKKFWNRGEILDLVGSKNSLRAWMTLTMNENIRKTLWSVWEEKFKDELKWLWDRKILSDKDYWNFIHKLQTEFNTVVATNGFNEVVEKFE